jgi:hypothetical protein
MGRAREVWNKADEEKKKGRRRGGRRGGGGRKNLRDCDA